MSKNLRIGRALGEIGPSVVVGAITTFLGVMVMAFASNAIFRVFFKMFLIIITFGVSSILRLIVYQRLFAAVGRHWSEAYRPPVLRMRGVHARVWWRYLNICVVCSYLGLLVLCGSCAPS